MLNRQFRIVVILIFLLTTIFIVVLQYNANKNIDELVAGNEKLLKEFRMRSRIQDLRNGVLSLDNNIRNTIIGKENSRKKIKKNVDEIQASVNELGELLVTDSNRVLWNRLNAITAEKIQVSYDVLDTFDTEGKDAAESIIRHKTTTSLNDEIEAISIKLDADRQNDLEKIIHKTDANSLQAKRFQGILAMVAVIIVLLTLWYVVNRIRKQIAMINALNESEKKVREAALVKEHFIANISHEIRTPLNAIIGFTRLLQKQPLNKNAAEYVASINSSGENLLSIINDVLDLSKIESGMMRLEKVPLSISSVAGSVYNMFATKAEEKHLDYQLHVEENLHDNYLGDIVRITQVLVNLVSNAIKFTSEGFVHIDITGSPGEKNTSILQLKVSDSGIGIDDNMKEQIFERFTQADEDTTRKYGGTGLGLSIVKQIVELMDGKIKVESLSPSGSAFTVSIPLEKMDAATTIVPETTEVKDQLKNIHARILVVEDNLMNQSLMKHLLHHWNFSFDIAGNGKEAISLLNHNTYDLILMDIQMPEMDGYTAAGIIRKELQLNMPIIAMTAHAFAGEREKCISYGMNDYLPKPVHEEELSRLLVRHLHISDHAQPKNGYDHNSKHYRYVNLQYLDELANGNEEFRRNILEQFLVQAPEELEQLQLAYYNHDIEAIKSRAHNLKTTVSFLGLQLHIEKELSVLQDKQKLQAANGEIKQSINKVLEVCNNAIIESRSIVSAL